MNPFLKISFRHLWHSRLYSVINIIGLAVAITCMLLAVLYWKHERSFDNFHQNIPNLFRITTTLVENKGSGIVKIGGTGQVQGPAFKQSVPEVKTYVRLMGGEIYNTFSSGDKIFSLQPFFVDESFFDVFSFSLLRGDPRTALKQIDAAVITESTARKFFNSIDVVGRFLSMDADPSFEKLGKALIISGVVKDPPKNSSLQFDVLLTFKFLHLSFEDTNWLNAYLGTFVVLHPDANITAVNRKFDQVYAANAKQQLVESYTTYGFNPQISYGLQPITDIHLNPLARTTGNAEGGVINGSSPVYSYMFMGIALFILLMAAINFINISIANSLKRSKEVGVRKIAGGSRKQIIFQFLNESALLCIFAFLLSMVLTEIFLPLFNDLTGKELVLTEAFDADLIFTLLAILVGIILMTGLYPAYALSNFKPSEVLYNKQKLSGRNIFGKALVILQFSLALFLLVSTIVYYNQMDYIRTKDLGYNPTQVLRTAVSGDRDYKQVINFLKNEVAKEPSIKMISFGSDGNTEDMYVNGKVFKGVYKSIDENFLPALEIPLRAGQNFSTGFSANEKSGAIVNEAFVKAAGLEYPIGQLVKVNRYYDSSLKTIIGVVKDFHFGSLREPIAPMAMFMNETPDGGIWIKFEKSKQRQAMAVFERIYKTAMPNTIYHFDFLDQMNAKQYQQEQRWHKVISIATTLSFLICCLGLFGLAHLSTHRRIKEIGIRKVLGASSRQIVTLLSGDFIKLVIISFTIAAPVAWIVMDKWLENFAYRTSISWLVFFSAGSIAIVVALATVSVQAIKAAVANPVKALRTE